MTIHYKKAFTIYDSMKVFAHSAEGFKFRIPHHEHKVQLCTSRRHFFVMIDRRVCLPWFDEIFFSLLWKAPWAVTTGYIYRSKLLLLRLLNPQGFPKPLRKIYYYFTRSSFFSHLSPYCHTPLKNNLLWQLFRTLKR